MPSLRWIACACLLVVSLGCSRSPVNAGSDAAGGTVDARGVGGVPGRGDVGGADATAVPDADAMPDADDPDADATELVPPVVDIATPERSDALDALYCELENGHLVQAALRGAACLDLSVAGVFDDASRGFVWGEMLRSGYAPVTLGYCELLRCLSNAGSCDEALACDAARRGGACEANTSRCDGDVLEVCDWTGEGYELIRVQECDRMGGRCVEIPCDGADCPERATCVGPEQTEVCGYYGRCDGDLLRRCLEPDPETGLPSEVTIDCSQLVEDGTCVEVAVGGEAPGPACLSRTASCQPSFAEGFACTGRATMSLCLYGEVIEIDCTEYGYSSCSDGGFFGARCGL